LKCVETHVQKSGIFEKKHQNISASLRGVKARVPSHLQVLYDVTPTVSQLPKNKPGIDGCGAADHVWEHRCGVLVALAVHAPAEFHGRDVSSGVTQNVISQNQRRCRSVC